jgi:cytochrome c'
MRRLVFVTIAFTSVVFTHALFAQKEHRELKGDEPIASPQTIDRRIPLKISPATQEAVRRTMREHLDALRAIIASLAQEDYAKAAAVAHEELGFPKHHQVMMREQGATFPPEYRELAMAHHQVAEELAQVISSKDMKQILPHLERTMKACVSCHEAYKL